MLACEQADLCLWMLSSTFKWTFGHSGPDNLENLRKLAEQFQRQAPEAAAAAAAKGGEDDDDVPDLVAGETFEQAAEEKQAS